MEKLLLQNLFKRVTSGAFEVTYWDGATEQYGESDPFFKLIFHEKIPYKRIVNDPVLTFGEAYMDGNIEFTGEMEQIIKVANSEKEFLGQNRAGRILKTLSRLPQAASLRKQQEDVQHHYDLGNDFFSLWLDDTMSYSCAYFQNPEDSLTQAQIQKIDHVLKKLELRSGESLLDIGSGWGYYPCSTGVRG